MFGAAHLTFNPYNAAQRPPPTSEDGETTLRAAREDEYEFLLETPQRARRSKLRKPFDDLPPGTVLQLAQESAVLELVDEDEETGGDNVVRPIPAPKFDVGEDSGDEDELLLKPGGRG